MYIVWCLVKSCNEWSPTSFAMAFLKEANLSPEDLERIAQGEVAAVLKHPCPLHPNEWTSLMHPGTRQSLRRVWVVATLLPTPQPLELCPKRWSRAAPRNMGDIFFAPIHACQASRWGLTLLGPGRRVTCQHRSSRACWACIAASWLVPRLENLPYPAADQISTGTGGRSWKIRALVDASPRVGWSGTLEAAILGIRGPVTGTRVHQRTGQLAPSAESPSPVVP